MGRDFEPLHGGPGLEAHACFTDEQQQHQGLRIPFLVHKPCRGRGRSWAGFLQAASEQLHAVTRQGMGTSRPPGRGPAPWRPSCPRSSQPVPGAELWVTLLHCSGVLCAPLSPGTVPHTVPRTEATARTSSAESAGPALADTVGRARPWVRTESPEGFRFQFQAIRNSSEAGGPLPPEIVVKSPPPQRGGEE